MEHMIRADVLKKYRQASLELGKQFKTGKFKTLKPEKAFIDWYVEARFGSLPKSKILDGKKDGGIDVIVNNDDTTYVIQSKYEVTSKVSLVTRADISAFENLSRKFKDPSCEDEFSTWLHTIR